MLDLTPLTYKEVPVEEWEEIADNEIKSDRWLGPLCGKLIIGGRYGCIRFKQHVGPHMTMPGRVWLFED